MKGLKGIAALKISCRLRTRYRHMQRRPSEVLLVLGTWPSNSSFNSDTPPDYPQAPGLSGRPSPGFPPASGAAGDSSFAKNGRGPAFSPRRIHGKAKGPRKRVAIAQPIFGLAPGVRGGGSRLIRLENGIGKELSEWACRSCDKPDEHKKHRIHFPRF